MSKNILHQTSWAKSVNGNDIELFSSETKNESPILFIGGVHGDEPEGVKLAQDLLIWLQKNNTFVNPQALEPWMLIPCLNIDGFMIKQRMNAAGVDLNRNFPSRDWSAAAKSPRYFPGPHPGSEPEVSALVTLIESTKPKLIVHFHSWEPCIVYTGSPGKNAAELIGKDTGYAISEDIGYPTPGSLGQFGWLEKAVPVICIEAQEGADLDSLWPTFGSGLKNLLTKDAREKLEL